MHQHVLFLSLTVVKKPPDFSVRGFFESGVYFSPTSPRAVIIRTTIIRLIRELKRAYKFIVIILNVVVISYEIVCVSSGNTHLRYMTSKNSFFFHIPVLTLRVI
ncbi:hypothetical protein DX884_04480 [Vibrio fluvialis]|nr:hypothetical protein [Vibrio fluvialis]